MKKEETLSKDIFTDMVMKRVDEYVPLIYRNLALRKESIENPLNYTFAFFGLAYANDMFDYFEFHSFTWPRLTLKVKDDKSNGQKILVNIYMTNDRMFECTVAYFGYDDIDSHICAMYGEEYKTAFPLIKSLINGNKPILTKANRYWFDETQRTEWIETIEANRGPFGVLNFMKEHSPKPESEEMFVNEIISDARESGFFNEKQLSKMTDLFRFLYKGWFRLSINSVNCYPDDDSDTIIIHFASNKDEVEDIELRFHTTAGKYLLYMTDVNKDIHPYMTKSLDEFETKLNFYIGNYKRTIV